MLVDGPGAGAEGAVHLKARTGACVLVFAIDFDVGNKATRFGHSRGHAEVGVEVEHHIQLGDVARANPSGAFNTGHGVASRNACGG